MDPLAGTNWSAPATVQGFARSSPNDVLMRLADLCADRGGQRAVDIGCGAGRNSVPLAAAGWRVVGVDLSWPMLRAAHARGVAAGVSSRVAWALAPMERLPIRENTADLIVAHGIWNLAPSVALFRQAVDEAARVARPGAALFVFTFSRHTLPPDLDSVAGEPFIFTEFSGRPMCFLTEGQLHDEMARAGFDADPGVPLREYNRRPGGGPRPGARGEATPPRSGRDGPGVEGRRLAGPPVIYEAAFRFEG